MLGTTNLHLNDVHGTGTSFLKPAFLLAMPHAGTWGAASQKSTSWHVESEESLYRAHALQPVHICRDSWQLLWGT